MTIVNLLSYQGKELNAIYIVAVALFIIRIVVPILLIVTASIDLVKAMAESDEKSMKKAIYNQLPKIVSAIIVFVLPSILLLILKIVNADNDFSNYSKCLLKPSSCDVKLWEEPPAIYFSCSQVTGECDEELLKLSIETYNSLTKNVNGIYTPDESFLTEEYVKLTTNDYVAGGKAVGNIKQTARPITDYVNVDEVNKKIADIVNKYGKGSREAIVEIAKLMGSLSEEYTVPYQLGGSYRSDATDPTSYLGINPNWGKLDSNGNLIGMDCRNSVIWIYGQAGVGLSRGLIYQGEGELIKDIKGGKPGDVIDSLGHIMLITDKDSEGYTVMEENGGYGWVQRKYTYNELENSYGENGSLDYHVYDMTKTIDGTNKYLKENKTGYGTLPVIGTKEDEAKRKEVYGEVNVNPGENSSSSSKANSDSNLSTNNVKEVVGNSIKTVIDKATNWLKKVIGAN